ERLRALRVPPELALERLEDPERLGNRAGVGERRQRAAGLPSFAQQRGAFEVTERSRLTRRGRSLLFERAQQRLAVAELAVRARDAREHVGIRRVLAPQPLEPRQRRRGSGT